jgi:hypothetical protein
VAGQQRATARGPGAKAFRWLTAAVVLAALVLHIVVLVADWVVPMPIRMLRLVSFLTIQSNVLVAGCALALALRPDRDGALSAPPSPTVPSAAGIGTPSSTSAATGCPVALPYSAVVTVLLPGAAPDRRGVAVRRAPAPALARAAAPVP